MRFAVSSLNPRSDFGAVFHVDDFALAPAERRLFDALNHHQVRFIILGMGAALLEGAPVATQDLGAELIEAADVDRRPQPRAQALDLDERAQRIERGGSEQCHSHVARRGIR